MGGPANICFRIIVVEQPNGGITFVERLSNYLIDFFKGVSGRKVVKVDFVVEVSGEGTYKRLSYEGDVEGIKDLFNTIQAVNDGKNA